MAACAKNCDSKVDSCQRTSEFSKTLFGWIYGTSFPLSSNQWVYFCKASIIVSLFMPENKGLQSTFI